jgi:FAD synthase
MRIIEGIVEHGDALGRQLGFPTANVPIADDSVEDGVWVALVRWGQGQWVPAAVSIGRRRTFFSQDGPRLLEAHLLDFQGDLYGALLQVQLSTKIRSQERFPTAEALIDQMHRDVQITREWVEDRMPWIRLPRYRNSAAKELV